MKTMLVLAMAMVLGTLAATAGGVGFFGSYWDTEDLGPGYGGGLKFKADLVEYVAVELRASCITKFDEWEGDDDLYVIPLEAALLFNLPLGENPLTLFGGGGGGYAILPEADDIDYDDEFAYFVVGGAEFALGGATSLFAEAQYRFLEVDGAKVDGQKVDGDEGGKLDGLSINAGLLFRF